jgi:pimeloyl-ACP methyl ester carboxylesterase
VLAAFATVVLAMSFSQTQLLFPTHAVPASGPLPPGAERLQLETADGGRLHGIHILPSVEGRGGTTLILGFGGNAWNGQVVAEYLHQLFPEAHVVAFHYRGYRPSTGSPSAEALIEDAPRIHDLAVDRVKPERTVAVGFSIGSGVAASLSQSRSVDGLILVTPFDSLREVAAGLFPWMPAALFQHELATADYLQGVQDRPVAIQAAEHDEIVPAERTEALRRRVPNLVFDRTFANVGHNDIYTRSEFQLAMREALEALR